MRGGVGDDLLPVGEIGEIAGLPNEVESSGMTEEEEILWVCVPVRL